MAIPIPNQCVVTWKRRCLHSRDCGPGDCSGSLQAREMMEGQLNNSVSQRKPYPRGTVDGYNLVRTFAAVYTARMGKLVPCHHSGAWQKPSLDIIWKKNDLKID
ncbi:hypothetical protein EMCRGX_G016737 [Ephydatia muelleri]